MTKETIDINEITIKKFVESIRPEDPEIRKQIDIGYTFDGSVAILSEIRPRWNDSSKIESYGFAKIRFYKSRKEWTLFWMRANGNWELYEPFPKSTHLDEIIAVIGEDANGCFFG